MFQRSFRLAFAASMFLFTGLTAEAAMQHKIESGALAPLEGPVRAGGRLIIPNVPLVDGEPGTLVLEEFNVLAPDAVIEVHREDGSVDHVKPQPMRQFRGYVKETPESVIYLSVGKDVQGLVLVKEHKFSVSSRARFRGAAVRDHDVFVEEIPVHEEVLSANGFTCDVERMMLTPKTASLPQSLTASGVVAGNAYSWPTGTATTTFNMAIDADSAMYANFGNNAAAVETYIRNLIGAASTIYRRDLRTDLRITLLAVWTSGGGADPFTVNPGVTSSAWNGGPVVAHTSSHALAEYGDWFHANRAAVKRSAAMLISGQPSQSGVAWIETACSNGGTCSGGNCNLPGENFFDGHRYGSYSYNGGVGGDGTVPDPNAGVNYVAPSTNYWSLLQIAHELGHNVQSPHTHCIDTNLGLAGIQPVDACVGGCVPQGPVPVEKGTIMSYCHLRVGGGTNTRYTFGKAGELSEVVITNMRNRLDVITPTGFSAITAPASLASGVSDVASVTNTAGLTYDWSIVNGTFAGGGTTATGASVTFSGTTNPVTLTVTATNSVGCGISDTKSVTITTPSFDPPANIVAAAQSPTSVQITYDAVPEATTYKIYRATSAGSFSEIGSTAALTYTDNTAVANTAYQYTVSAGVSPTFSVFGTPDLATTVIFTDPTLTAQSTKAKLVHFTELLTAVNAVRTLAGLGTISFTAPAPTTSVTVRRQHLLDLRAGLDAARAGVPVSALTYTDPSITVQSTTIKAAHINELRAGVQ